jgi:hypothetical protein
MKQRIESLSDFIINEGASQGYQNLVAFNNDLLKEFKIDAKKTSAILLDTVGGFGFEAFPKIGKETVLVVLDELQSETKLDAYEIYDKIIKVYDSHKSKISKKEKDDKIAFSYK